MAGTVPPSSGQRTPSLRETYGRVLGDINGGLTAALVSVATAIGLGVIVFAPFGAAGIGFGVVSVIIGQVLGGAIGAAVGSTRGLSISVTASAALLLAGLVTTVVGKHPAPEAVGMALAAVMMCAVLSGIFVVVLSLLRVATVVPLVPYPVIAGIVNGAAVLLVLSLLRYAVGDGPVAGNGLWLPVAPMVAGTVIAMMYVRRRGWIARVPAVLVACLAGTVMHHALSMVVGPANAGPLVGGLPSALAAGDNLLLTMRALQQLDVAHLLVQVAPVALSIALLATLETLTAASAVHDAKGRDGRVNQDLRAAALGSVISGLAGGTPVAGSVTTSLAILGAGGSTWLAPFLRSVFLLAVVLLLAPAVALVPMSVLAGVLIFTGVRLLDIDGLRSMYRALRFGGRHRAELVCHGLVMLLVAGISVHWSLVVGMLVGVPLALAVFVVAMGGDLVRRTYRNPTGRSRLHRPERETAILIDQGVRIAVIELEGAIFFGSADTIARRVETERTAGAGHIVLDMRRVTSIDLSGARRLVQTCERLWRAEVRLSLACVRPGWVVWDYLEELGLLGRLRKAHVFSSLDEALEEAETALLVANGAAATGRLSPSAALRGLGLPEGTVTALLPRMEEVCFEAGHTVIRSGDEARSVYLVLSGQLEVTIPLVATASSIASRTRLCTITAGTLVGEMALLSGAPRSADVVARTPAICLRFDASTFAVLRRDQPDAAYDLLKCIALQIDRNLRLANMTVAVLEG
jgi:MFS superfamily sulfate permease-like transporter/CRP-like cAMP-binding protein